MLDVRLFRNRRFSAASGAITLAFFALFGTIFFLTQYLQSVLGYGAFESGLRVMPVAAGLVLGGPLSAKLAERVGTKRVVGAGLALVAVGLTMLSGAEVDTGYGLVAAVLLRARARHGPDDGARHGVGHGLAAARQGERRLGGQRRDAHDGRRARRRGARVAPVQRLPCRHGRRHPGPPERGAERRTSRSPARSPWPSRIGGGTGGRVSDAAQQAFVDGMHDRSARRRRDRRRSARVITLVALPARAARRAAGAVPA